MKNNGFGLLGILIALMIIAILMVGGFYASNKNSGEINKIERGREAIKDAENLKIITNQNNNQLLNALNEK
jgi:type II secretory pathway pseudopilin PulG